jgi:hypothetical protein
MTLDDYTTAWRTQPVNAAGDARTATLQVVAQMERSRRRERLLLGLFGVNTLAATIIVIAAAFLRRPNVAAFLPLVGAQLCLMLTLGLLVRRHRRRARLTQLNTASVKHAAACMLADITAQIFNIRLLAATAAIVLMLLAVTAHTLHAAGKMDEKAVVSYTILCLVIVGTNAAIQGWRYRYVLRPGRARVMRILKELEAV